MKRAAILALVALAVAAIVMVIAVPLVIVATRVPACMPVPVIN